ncbi:MAG: short-chain dehydrogenase [Bacteroidetes bacterium]|nr:short-chain dehydrogenase [Bacteroidota bacterium]
MKTTSKNTILITGGSAGIGFETAKAFSEKGNTVIITGRDPERLKNAAAKLKNVTAIACDVSKDSEVRELVKRLNTEFPQLNMVVNNAGRALFYNLAEENINGFEKAGEEMLTNYLSIIRLNELLLPLLKKQKEAAIVNVSSVVAFVPSAHLATYAGSKAALHSYSLSLRIALAKDTAIKVFELMPPLVNTDFSQEIGGANGIAPSVVAEALLNAIDNNEYEIRVGNTENVYKAFLASPEGALKMMNA